MEKFYLLYPAMFAKYLERKRNVEVVGFYFAYNEIERKYFWVIEANYTLIKEPNNFYYTVPFSYDSIESLFIDIVGEKGKYVKFTVASKLVGFDKLEPAQLEISDRFVLGRVETISASVEKKDVLQCGKIAIILLKKEDLWVLLCNDNETQQKIFNEHKRFIS